MPIIIGAGVSGLAAAHYLLQKGITDIKIFEVTHRVGGWIKSTNRNGIIFEHGPHTIRPKGIAGKNTLKLIEDLKLEDQILSIPDSHPAVKNRLIYVNKSLHKLPHNFLSSFKKTSPFTKPLISALWNDFVTPAKQAVDETIYDFSKRRFGQEVADYAVSPMVCGICGGDAKEISVKFLMNDLFEKEQKHGGIVKGMFYDMFKHRPVSDIDDTALSRRAFSEGWSIYSLKGGLETLPRELERHLRRKEVEINFGSNVTDLSFEGDHAKIVINGNQEVFAEHVISTLPPHRLAVFFAKSHPQLFHDLKSIPSVSIAVVNLMYDNELIREPGFGFLIPPSEKVPILGVIYDSCMFPVRGKTVLTVMLGGKWFESLFGKVPKKEEIYDVALKEINKILGLSMAPVYKEVKILDSAIPQYVIGHVEKIKRMRKYIDDNRMQLSLCGAAYDGVGMNDVVLSARRVVDRLTPEVVSLPDSTRDSVQMQQLP